MADPHEPDRDATPSTWFLRLEQALIRGDAAAAREATRALLRLGYGVFVRTPERKQDHGAPERAP